MKFLFNPMRRYADRLLIKDSVVKKVDSIWKELLYYYDSEGHKLPDDQLMIKIDKLYGDRVSELLNKPLHFLNGAGAFLVTILLRQQFKSTVDVINNDLVIAINEPALLILKNEIKEIKETK